MTFPRRRRSDSGPWANIKFALLNGNIDMVMLLAAVGLLTWVIFGFTAAQADLENYARMFPVGGLWFWVSAYIVAACGLIYLVAFQMPPMASLMVGGWLVTIWSWSFFARATHVYTAQTGNATSILYILIGVLILQRSGSR